MGSRRFWLIEFASGPEPMTMQLLIAQALDNETERENPREYSIDSEDTQYEDDVSSEESMEDDE